MSQHSPTHTAQGSKQNDNNVLMSNWGGGGGGGGLMLVMNSANHLKVLQAISKCLLNIWPVQTLPEGDHLMQE